MRISELAERSAVPASTLRFYETIGLLPAARTAAGYRDYDEGAADRLHVITEAKRLGLTLDDIGELLGVWTSGSCASTKAALRPRLVARLSAAQRGPVSSLLERRLCRKSLRTWTRFPTATRSAAPTAQCRAHPSR